MKTKIVYTVHVCLPHGRKGRWEFTGRGAKQKADSQAKWHNDRGEDAYVDREVLAA